MSDFNLKPPPVDGWTNPACVLFVLKTCTLYRSPGFCFSFVALHKKRAVISICAPFNRDGWAMGDPRFFFFFIFYFSLLMVSQELFFPWRRSITSPFLRHSHVIVETVMSDLCWQLCYEVCGCKVSGNAAKEFPFLHRSAGTAREEFMPP